MSPERRGAPLRRNEDEYALLLGVIDDVRAKGRIDAEFDGTARDRSVRDVLAHLHAWHLLLEQWHAEGINHYAWAREAIAVGLGSRRP